MSKCDRLTCTSIMHIKMDSDSVAIVIYASHIREIHRLLLNLGSSVWCFVGHYLYFCPSRVYCQPFVEFPLLNALLVSSIFNEYKQ